MNISIYIYSDFLVMFGYVMFMIGVFSFCCIGFFCCYVYWFIFIINSNKGWVLDCGYVCEVRFVWVVCVVGYCWVGFVDGV